MKIVPNKSLVHPEYLARYCLSDFARKFFISTAKHSTMTTIAQSDIAPLQVLIPPLPEQQKIAAILTSVDEVIENTQAQINKLKDLKTGMMQELLTRGVGVDGKPHTEFKDSPVGRIPKGWEVSTLGDEFQLSSGSTPSRKESTYFSSDQSAIPWVKTTNLNDSYILTTDEKITLKALNETSCKLHPKGTALIAMYGGWNQIGRSGLLTGDATTNQAIVALVFKKRIIGEFVNYWLIANRHRWQSIAASSRKDPNITKQDVSDFLIVVPSIQEQEDLVDRFDSLTQLIYKNQKKMDLVKNTKKALMQDLLTGKVRVKVDTE
ncbi:restriction endonuclease subunit S [Aliivibrio salmonicida]|nr:restriction endonuclease subunit S [Aliivibrio salmonicida]AZL85002.1 restriction endonuclease subunit S [Aliivibrio salmonicida]